MRLNPILLCAGVISLLSLSSCREDEIRTYRVAADASSQPEGAATEPSSQETPPKLEYTKPDGWEPSSGSAMRAASFLIAGTSGEADVAVVPLPGDAGSLLDNVNRWRGQLRLAPLKNAQGSNLGSTIKGSSGEFLVTHLVSEEPLLDDGGKAAISAAVLKKGDYTWFFKMTGASETVLQNRAKFESFVRSAVIP